ncbi:unnamed protein product [Echinostoma caproni]|uniref:phosphopyruvate hydratase n=1 Tax=Echinostoma caproni TaxID=27848 RepID=A0A183A8B6_9TREM|nr:unnamed protein product [Echinostoma caproni]
MATPLTEKQLKAKAIQYYRENSVLKWTEQVLNKMFHDNPQDTAGYLTLMRLRYSVPKQQDEALTSVESDEHLGVETLFEEEILPHLFEKPLTSHSLELIDEKLRTWFDQRSTSRQKQGDTMELTKTEAAPKATGVATKPTGQGNTRAKTSRPSTSQMQNSVIELASPAAFHCSAVSLASLIATCTSAHLATPKHRAIEQIVSEILSKMALSTPEVVLTPRYQLPLPIITLLNGIVVGSLGSGQLCKCLRHILLIPKPTLSPTEASFITTHPGTQMLCTNGAPALPMDRPERGLDFVLEAMQQLHLKDQFLLGLHLISRSIYDPVKGKYEPVTGMLKTPEEMVNYYADLVAKYPQVQLLIEPFRREDAQCWSMLQDRLRSQVLIATTNIPQSNMSPGGAGSRKISNTRPGSSFGPPSSPSIATVAQQSRAKLSGSDQTLASTIITADGPTDSNPVLTDSEQHERAQASITENEERSSATGVPNSEEEDKPQEIFSAWFINPEAGLDCCLVTELIQAVHFMHGQQKQTIFDGESMKYADAFAVDIPAIVMRSDALPKTFDQYGCSTKGDKLTNITIFEQCRFSQQEEKYNVNHSDRTRSLFIEQHGMITSDLLSHVTSFMYNYHSFHNRRIDVDDDDDDDDGDVDVLF